MTDKEQQDESIDGLKELLVWEQPHLKITLGSNTIGVNALAGIMLDLIEQAKEPDKNNGREYIK